MADGELVLVGTPYTPAAMTEVLGWMERRFGQRKMTAIDTGYHVDNLGGNSALLAWGIPVYGSDLTAQLLRERGEQTRQLMLSMLAGPDNERYYKAQAEIPYVAPDHLFSITQGLKLSFGEEQVEVYYPGPSQAPDKVAVYFPRQKVLFGGCMILGGDQVGNTADADLKNWPEAVRKLKAFDAEVVAPGHGERVDPGLIEHTITLLTAPMVVAPTPNTLMAPTTTFPTPALSALTSTSMSTATYSATPTPGKLSAPMIVLGGQDKQALFLVDINTGLNRAIMMPFASLHLQA